jgi:hypothetical protein
LLKQSAKQGCLNNMEAMHASPPPAAKMMEPLAQYACMRFFHTTIGRALMKTGSKSVSLMSLAVAASCNQGSRNQSACGWCQFTLISGIGIKYWYWYTNLFDKIASLFPAVTMRRLELLCA